jgi:hypothetical protein
MRNTRKKTENNNHTGEADKLFSVDPDHKNQILKIPEENPKLCVLCILAVCFYGSWLNSLYLGTKELRS